MFLKHCAVAVCNLLIFVCISVIANTLLNSNNSRKRTKLTIINRKNGRARVIIRKVQTAEYL